MNGTKIEALTIRAIVEMVTSRGDADSDPWRLSLVQRDRVWTDVQVSYLLDSLLLGYPIGSILLCSVVRDGHVLEPSGGSRRAVSAPEGTFQLLDGQQRLNALERLFTRPLDPGSPSYFLALDTPRDLEDVVQRRRDVARKLRYIRPIAETSEEIDHRRMLAVSGCQEALRNWTAAEVVARTRTEAGAWSLARAIDPAFDDAFLRSASDEVRARAHARVGALTKAYVSSELPVMKVHLETPLDVLQVFTRVNRTGVQVSNEDVFFAAVKTMWHDAEEHVSRITTRLPFFGRSSALRFLTRHAASTLARGDATADRVGDLLPLAVERLNGEDGRLLVDAMRTLAATNSPMLARLESFASRAREPDGLGRALTLVPPTLLDPIVTWAAHLPDEAWLANDLHAAWEYLLGATAFRYRTVFADKFEKLAWSAAVEAGANGTAFPLDAIVDRTRERWSKLQWNRASVRSAGSPGEKRARVNDHPSLWLSVAQRLPMASATDAPLDWEHLFAVALGDERKWHVPAGKKRREHHADSGCFYKAGNLMALDASLNRSLGKAWPDEKLARYEAANYGERALFLSISERATLLEACARFREGRNGDGFAVLKRYVEAREDRIFDTVTSRFPGMLRFAGVETA